jgi:hypothetical protein
MNAFIRRPTALSMGLDDNGIAQMRSSGQWGILRHGAYVDVQRMAGASAEERHRMLIEASLPIAADNAAVSHVSAAILHRHDVWGIPLGTVHLTRPGHGGGHRRRWIHTHVSPLRPDEVMEIDGIPVTTPARTVLDLARAAGMESSVVTADHALHIKSVTPEELEDARQRAMGWPGMVRAARVLAFADGLAESPGESRSRLHIARAGLPKPRLQVHIWSADGFYLGRVDFWFEEFRTVGEFDGRVKYGRMLAEKDLAENVAEKIGRIVFEEKRREDAIRALPLSVGRWVWDDINGRSVNILSQAFRTGRSLLTVPLQGRIECS